MKHSMLKPDKERQRLNAGLAKGLISRVDLILGQCEKRSEGCTVWTEGQTESRRDL